jgi:hypothetical protein
MNIIAALLCMCVAISEPATIPETSHATRGEHVRLMPAPVETIETECAEWFDLSMEAGFEKSDWPKMSVIMYRESRCQPDVHNATDPSGGSFGLMQVNCSWRRYLADRGIITRCHDLFDPYNNLAAARAIVQYDRDRGQCDWKQWATKRGMC